jgi:hypothetical protein
MGTPEKVQGAAIKKFTKWQNHGAIIDSRTTAAHIHNQRKWPTVLEA